MEPAIGGERSSGSRIFRVDVRQAAGVAWVQSALAGRELLPGGSLVGEQLVRVRAESAPVQDQYDPTPYRMTHHRAQSPLERVSPCQGPDKFANSSLSS
jgi:hypothetical protein